MRKSVVPDRVALVVNPFRDTGELVGLDADQEESSSRILLLEDVENLWSPLRIRTVVKGECNLVRAVTVAADAVGLRQVLEDLVGDHVASCIHRQIARAMRGLVFDP